VTATTGTWQLNPESVTAVVTAITGAGILVSAVFAVRQVREGRRARDADVLLKLLELVSNQFPATDAYVRLLDRANAMRSAGETMRWRGPLDGDDVVLLRLLKLYAVVGWMLQKRMVNEDVLLQFIAEPLLHHYHDFGPFIATSMEREGIEILRSRALHAGFRPSALRDPSSPPPA